ncbi:FUSC family protein [Psychrobacter sp.]|uniref:FUSC family protein n=1 Tax=Psychrobacter sp. TaxID=56811 RepID=UPI0025E68E75|nr:FUSC family protein [Psychrobacter sp.]
MIKQQLKQLAKQEAEHLFTLKPNPRPLHVGIVAALTIASTIFIAALFNQLPTGVLASLGAMIILNQPNSGTLRQRQGLMFFMGIMMISSFCLGLIAHNLPGLRTLIISFMALSIVFIGRYLRLPPPSGMFILMASFIAVFMPVGWDKLLYTVAIVAFGAIYAWVISLFYNLLIIRPSTQRVEPNHRYESGLLTESVIVSAFVILALEVALWLDLSHPYWAPVSCYIIMQGINLRSMWIKQFHRILGTGIGMFVAWYLMSIPLSDIEVAIAIFFMLVWVEIIIIRHYALGVLMVTPLTIFIAEYGGSHSVIQGAALTAHQGIIEARFVDTVIGCGIALLGGVVMHSTWLRQPMMNLETKLLKATK